MLPIREFSKEKGDISEIEWEIFYFDLDRIFMYP